MNRWTESWSAGRSNNGMPPSMSWWQSSDSSRQRRHCKTAISFFPKIMIVRYVQMAPSSENKNLHSITLWGFYLNRWLILSNNSDVLRLVWNISCCVCVVLVKPLEKSILWERDFAALKALPRSSDGGFQKGHPQKPHCIVLISRNPSCNLPEYIVFYLGYPLSPSRFLLNDVCAWAKRKRDSKEFGAEHRKCIRAEKTY